MADVKRCACSRCGIPVWEKNSLCRDCRDVVTLLGDREVTVWARTTLASSR